MAVDLRVGDKNDAHDLCQIVKSVSFFCLQEAIFSGGKSNLCGIMLHFSDF